MTRPAKPKPANRSKSRASRKSLEEQVGYEILLNMIIQDIRGSFDLQETLLRAAQGLGEALHAQMVHVGTCQVESRSFHLQAIYHDPSLSVDPLLAPPFVLVDQWDLSSRLEPTVLQHCSLVEGHAPLSLLLALSRPRNREAANGIILVSDLQGLRDWQDWEMALVQAVAEHLGVVIAWHNLLLKQKQDSWVAQTIHRISTNIRHTLQTSEILKTLMHELATELQLPLIQIYDQDNDSVLYSDGDPHIEAWKWAQDLTHLDLDIPETPEPQLIQTLIPGKVQVYALALQAGVQLRVCTPENTPLSLAHQRILTATARSTYAALLQAQAQQQMAELNQLKSSLISNVSHELRTPLTSILLLVSTLLEDNTLQIDEEAVEMLQLLKQESHRLNILINDLLDYSRLEADKSPWPLVEIELAPLTRQINQSLQPLYQQRQQTIQWTINPNLPMVMGISGRIMQVFINLLTNASKFSPTGSEMRVRIDLKDSAMIKVVVEDQGRGIPLADQKRIFERFTQVEGTQGGTGLGLAICREIVQRMGGEIGVHSAPDQGSCFWFTLGIAGSGSPRSLKSSESH